MSSWWGKDDTGDPRGENDYNNRKRENQISPKTKIKWTQGNAADAEVQGTGVPSTWDGTGHHSKEPRSGLRMYGSRFSPPDNAPWGCIFAGRLFAVSLARHALADDAPRVWVHTGWHDPYPSSFSLLESKYCIQIHPTIIPALEGMLKGSGAQMAYRLHKRTIALKVSV